MLKRSQFGRLVCLHYSVLFMAYAFCESPEDGVKNEFNGRGQLATPLFSYGHFSGLWWLNATETAMKYLDIAGLALRASRVGLLSSCAYQSQEPHSYYPVPPVAGG